MAESAKARGTGIAKRTPEYIRAKIAEGKAVIALSSTGEWAGFCYIETWEGEYVANSGLIVSQNSGKADWQRPSRRKSLNSAGQIPGRKNLRTHHRACGDENQQRTGL